MIFSCLKKVKREERKRVLYHENNELCNIVLKYSLSFVIVLGLWEAYARYGGLNELFLPRPSKIGDKLFIIYFQI